MNWETTLKKITDESAYNAAMMWVDKPTNLKLINNQINCVYRFEFEDQGYYLRITHEQIRPYNELAAAIDFQNHLFFNDAPVCQAINSKNNAFIETIKQVELEFLAHVCIEVPGNVIDFDDTSKEKYFKWGKSLATLHRASQSYQPKEHHFRTWRDLWKETEDYLHGESNEIKDLHQKIASFFNQLTPTPSNFGLTHGDHRPGNVLYDGNKVYIIDFDEPVHHWYMADIAKPYLDLCAKPHETWKQLFDWYIEGYCTILPINNTELKQINWFTQMKSLDIYLWCKNNWYEPTAPGGKPRDQWLSELKQMALCSLFNF
ncbi:TPA: phosphotransferase [Legionella pneumophila]|uniref:Homoserine kinase n=1 Tax=Legionella waltersii TaxID=66969 RepID=A0A0W1A0M9_9GAMM|nr:phosphotransferase [Legionella waltersii]HAU3626769.1 phosphotransferase [Legionella pneumophila]KTD74884.1 homoserine kinase [Legionella waltersii]SNV12064.1 Protein kinase-like [Legionella waltersii]HAU3646498.1 phosphotransferase [Legionella pneumophila]HAU3652857.1 phosphotransferase [Legionella pneumophila]